MTTEENLAIVRRWAAAINGGDLDLAIRYLAPDYVGHLTGTPEPVQGPQALKEMYQYFIQSAFPDQHITLEVVAAAGDKVATRMSWTATHQGDFMGLPPTGKPVVVEGTGIFRIADGLIAEEWMQEDFVGITPQLTQTQEG